MRKHDIVVVANRLPVRRVREGRRSGWKLSPGGMVSALAPIVSTRRCLWIGWSGVPGKAPRPFRYEGLDVHPLPISAEELDGFYFGFSNATLWPLYHDAIRWPEYHREWWGPYQEVNRRFAEEAARETAKGGVVWVHDYHLQLVPGMLRELRPDLRIGFFLHVPFPPQELFAQLPWRAEILRGLLGADVVGFQTKVAATNFSVLARRYAGARGNVRELHIDGRNVTLGTFPVSIDVDRFEELAAREETERRTAEIREQVAPARKIVLGVDRLDYTKGIDIWMRAFRELLHGGEVEKDELTLVQTAVPSRDGIPTYQKLKNRVEQLVGRINGELGEMGVTPVHYLHRNLPAEELVALYRAADVMLVTPLRDGMNLVAKEYVATRLDDTGVLVLSEFTGSAHELDAALLVNPHDIDAVSATILRAARMPVREQKRRMRSLRRAVRRHDVHDWGREFLEALEK